MKKWMEKFKEIKTAQWALVLIVMGLAISFLFPSRMDDPEIFAPDEEQGVFTHLETRLARVLSGIEGAGRVEVIIHHENVQTASSGWVLEEETKNGEGRPVGAVVVAQGADQLAVRLHLAQAVETLLGLDAQNVEVFAMKQEGEGQS